jgi:hypothetical protein
VTFRRPAVAAAALAVLAALGACTGHHTPVAGTTVTQSTDSPVASSDTATPATSSTPSTSAGSSFGLAGSAESAGKPVIAVKIDNTPPARPQTNVNAADIVYVELVEGDATRLMAVYQSTLPQVVGPVRSGRESDLEILAAFGRVALAYSGANRGVERLIKAAPLRSYEEGAPGFFRSSGRHAPYNLYVNPQRLLAAHPDLPTARDIGFVFGAALPDGAPASSITVSMSPYTKYSFLYDAAADHWLAAINGRPTVQVDGQRLWAGNVLVQQVSVNGSRFHDVLGLVTPRSHTVGSGPFTLLRPDGTQFHGTWTRASASEPTTYLDSSGVAVTLAPGRTWVLLAPKGNSVVVA